MFRRFLPLTAVCILILSTESAGAQSQASVPAEVIPPAHSLIVTAATGKEQVRFASFGLVLKMRLEILSQSGERIYDSANRDGSLLDWRLEDGQGNRLSDGLYGCLITAEDISGRLISRRGVFWMKDGFIQFGKPVPGEESLAATADEPGTVTVLSGDDTLPVALLAHDGAVGRVVSGKGGLSFRAGDMFAGKDLEQMRLTADGRLGLGVEDPATKLDVAGMIRTTEGIMFPDGTVQKTAANPIVISAGITAGGNVPGLGNNASRILRDLYPGTATGGARVMANSGDLGKVSGSEGTYNTLYGQGAGSSLGAAYYNSLFGYYSGYAITTGNSNSMFGDVAGRYNSTGNQNTYVGANAGYNGTAGSNNTFVGFNSGKNNTASGNTFAGYNAGLANTSGAFNAYFGSEAGAANTTGCCNTFAGIQAGKSNTTGFSNTFLGDQTGYANTTGNYNIMVGGGAGYNIVSGSNSTFVGFQAGLNTTASDNSFVGYRAGQGNTTGADNSFFGTEAGSSNTTASGNSFFGRSAGYANTAGYFNAFFGFQAGKSNLAGYGNSYLGYQAGNLATGNGNTFVGDRAGLVTTVPCCNSFLGASAGIANTTGSANVFVGTSVGTGNTTGGANTFVGTNSGAGNTTEIGNTFIGFNSVGDPAVTNATALGYLSKVTQSNSLVLGSVSGQNGAAADTKVGIGTTAPAGTFHVKSGINEILFAGSNGKVGIGTSTPDKPLQIVSTGLANAELHVGGAGDEAKDVFSGMGVDLSIGPAFNFGYSGFSFGRSSGFFNVRPDASAVAPNPSLRFLTGNQQRMIITNLGRVGIGTTNPTELLHVAGNLRVAGLIYSGAAELDVPDYVFEPDYKLMPVADLEKFLASEKHLPNIPSASEIKEKGLSLSEFQMKLLEKIEELTLYSVQQARTNRDQELTLARKEAEIMTLRSQNTALDARVAALEQMMEKLMAQKQ